jgi:hypothetical protein
MRERAPRGDGSFVSPHSVVAEEAEFYPWFWRKGVHYAAMPDRSRKRPCDTNQLAAAIIAEATRRRLAHRDPDVIEKNSAAVVLGRLGGLRGGTAWAEEKSPIRLSDTASKATQARYGEK